MIIRVSFIVALVFLTTCQSANILFFFTGGTYSHDIAIWPLVIRLIERNHSVTFFSAHSKKPWDDPRVNVIKPPKIEEINSRYLGDTLKLRLENQERLIWRSIPWWSFDICEYILSPAAKNETGAVLYDQKFDLVILDSVLCDCGYIVAYHHDAKVIVSDSTNVLPWFHHIFGFPTESTWLPFVSMVYPYPMSISDMIWNFVEPFYRTYLRRAQFYPKLDLLMKQFFKTHKELPKFLELERRADLVFLNSHPSVELPRSLPPNFVQIGGLQMWGKNLSIPERISHFMEKAEDGVILLAFGSSIDFSSIPAYIESVFFTAFRHFPKIHFIVKASGARPSDCPENLQFEKWIPQKEVLAHNKTIACITHGGLNGVIEATWSGVPLITIPIFAEQDYQSYKLQARNLGIRLELRDLNAEDLSSAIFNITTNPLYRSNMKKMQESFRDRPESPIELATYWTEYVLKHTDLSHMNPITYQPWRVQLDEYIFAMSTWTTIAITLLLTLACIPNYFTIFKTKKNINKM